MSKVNKNLFHIILFRSLFAAHEHNSYQVDKSSLSCSGLINEVSLLNVSYKKFLGYINLVRFNNKSDLCFRVYLNCFRSSQLENID